MKRFFKLLLTCILIFVMIPADASAAASGTIDENISWTLSDDGTLLVYGSGGIPDYGTYDSPWYDNDSITSVIMESGITRIGRNSFRNCSNLAEVTLPSNLKEIGSFAFINSGLTEITFPEGLQTIENNAFSSLPIARMELPDSVIAVDPTNFSNHLTYLKWTAGIPVVPAEVFDGRTLLETVVIPEGVTEIADGPNDYSGAFTDCTALKSVSLPSTMIRIGDYAFKECTALEEIHVEAEMIGYGAFDYCIALKAVTLCERLKEIGSYGLAYCKSLTALELPEGLTTIGNCAFAGSAITKLSLPDTVTSVSVTGMGGSLQELRWSGGVPVVPARTFYNFSLLETVVFPEGVTEIADAASSGDAAFYGCSSLKSVSLPSTMIRIGDYAFKGCTALEEIYVEAETIGYNSFNYCPGLNSVTLSERIREIGSYAFGQCGVIEELKFQGDAPTIEEYAFNYATVTAYYPAGNVTWTKDFMEAFYGGTINWVPYGSTEGDDEKDPESSTPDLDWFFAMAEHIDENYLWATSFYIRLMEKLS